MSGVSLVRPPRPRKGQALFKGQMKKQSKLQRKRRVRAKVSGIGLRPRLSVFRSNRFTDAQIIDDTKGKTLVSFSSRHLPTKTSKTNKTEIAGLVGEELAKRAKRKKITKVVFDKGSYRYHGRVKALAEGARKGGLKF